MAALNAIQAEVASTRNRNWAIIQEQFDAFEQKFHILRVCNQMLFSNQQPNVNFDTYSSLLARVHASIKSYRSALSAYHMHLLNAVPVLLRGHSRISLIPKHSFIVLLESVAIQQSKAADRVSLAIPLTDLLSDYDSRLLADAITVPEGHWLTLNVPSASRQTVFTLFEGKLISMLHPNDPQAALLWNIKAPYFAISEDQKESSVLTSVQFEH